MSPAKFSLRGACGLPATARAAQVTVTLFKPTAPGHLRIYAADTVPAVFSTMNFPANEPALANGTITSLAQDGAPADVIVEPFPLGGGQVHVVIDVYGYYARPLFIP